MPKHRKHNSQRWKATIKMAWPKALAAKLRHSGWVLESQSLTRESSVLAKLRLKLTGTTENNYKTSLISKRGKIMIPYTTIEKQAWDFSYDGRCFRASVRFMATVQCNHVKECFSILGKIHSLSFSCLCVKYFVQWSPICMHTHTPMAQPSGHFDMHTGGAGDWTHELLISACPALLLSQSKTLLPIKQHIVSFIFLFVWIKEVIC